jgi:hypothetical protein
MKVLGVKKNCQNGFGEIGRLPCRTRCLFSIVRYWFKILCLNERKYVKIVYKDMFNTIKRHPNTFNLAKQSKRLLSQYSFLSCMVISKSSICQCVIRIV